MYITVTNANDLLSGQPDIDDWNALSIAQKNSYLQRASRRIEMIEFVNDELEYPQGYAALPRYVNNYKQVPQGQTTQYEIELPIALACARLAIHYMRNPLADFVDLRSGTDARDSAFMDDLPIDVQSALWSFTSPDQRDDEETAQEAEQNRPRRTAASISYGDQEVESQIENPLGFIPSRQQPGQTTGDPTGMVDPSQIRQIVDEEVADWAEEGNTDQIPANKLQNAGGAATDTVARTAAAGAQRTADANNLNISANASNISANASAINAVGSRVTTAEAEIDALESAEHTLEVQDEGTKVGADASILDFVGAGVTVSGSGAKKTITIEGGGGGGGQSGGSQSMQAEEVFSSSSVKSQTFSSSSRSLALGNFNLEGLGENRVVPILFVGEVRVATRTNAQIELNFAAQANNLVGHLQADENGETIGDTRAILFREDATPNAWVKIGGLIDYLHLSSTKTRTLYLNGYAGLAGNTRIQIDFRNVKAYRVLAASGGSSSSSGPGVDQTARDGVTANKALIDRNKTDIGALSTAVQGVDREAKGNTAAITALETQDSLAKARIDALEELRVGARIKMYPETHDTTSALVGHGTIILEDLQQDILLDGVDPIINRFDLQEVESGTVVHTEAWLYSGSDQELRFEITSDEATAIGLVGSEDYVRFIGYFHNTDGDVVAQTNQFVVAIGTRGEFPAVKDDLAKTDPLSIRDRIELVGLSMLQKTIPGDDIRSIQGIYTMRIENPPALPMNVWAEVLVGSRVVEARKAAWEANASSPDNYTIDIGQPDASGIGTIVRASKVIPLEVRLWDAATGGKMLGTKVLYISVAPSNILDNTIGLDELKLTKVANERAYDSLSGKDAQVIYWWPA